MSRRWDQVASPPNSLVGPRSTTSTPPRIRQRVTAPAWAEYKRATAPAWAEYERVWEAAWAEYERATDAALAEYKRVTAPAFVRITGMEAER